MPSSFVVVLIAILFILIYIFFREAKKQKQFRPRQKLNKRADQQLLIMLNGDKNAALRLLRSARQNNPGRTYLWYHEKVIRDLERDRRY